MKAMHRMLLFLSVASILSGCKKENMCDCLNSTGPIVSEKRSLDPFHMIEVRKNVIVTLYQDTVEYVEVEAGSHLIDMVKTEVSGGVLSITNLNTCNWVRSYDIEVHARVHLKTLDYLVHYGSQEIRCADTLLINEIDIREFNSADIKLIMKAQKVYARQMVGGGDIYLSGSSQFCYTFGGSFGYIYAQDFISDIVQVDHQSTGEIHVHPVSWLGVHIADHGNVYYRGSPEIVSDITGSGELIQE